MFEREKINLMDKYSYIQEVAKETMEKEKLEDAMREVQSVLDLFRDENVEFTYIVGELNAYLG